MDKRLTANFGFRLDEFSQDRTTSQNGGAGVVGHSDLNMVEPRLNLAYALPGRTVLRASYNRLMIIPPSAQGATPGDVVPPERIDQFEASAEKQTGPGESIKVRAYQKQIRDQLDTGLLVPGTQIGAFVTDSIPKDYIRGVEFSYNLLSMLTQVAALRAALEAFGSIILSEHVEHLAGDAGLSEERIESLRFALERFLT